MKQLRKTIRRLLILPPLNQVKLALFLVLRYCLLIEYQKNIIFLLYKLKHHALYKSIVIFDIDNTIANTWPSLVNRELNQSEYTRLLNLPAFEGMATIVKQANKSSTTKVIFLSHRPRHMTTTTRHWLCKNQLYSRDCSIILVPKPKYKYWLIKNLTMLDNKKVIYYDDLSYHHELGKIEFYEDIIQKVKALNLIYIGYEEINTINNITSLKNL